MLSDTVIHFQAKEARKSKELKKLQSLVNGDSEKLVPT